MKSLMFRYGRTQRKIPSQLVCGSCGTCADHTLPMVQVTAGLGYFYVFRSFSLWRLWLLALRASASLQVPGGKISEPIHSNGAEKFNKTIKPAILFYNSTKNYKGSKLCIFCCILSYISSMMSSQKVIISPAFNYWVLLVIEYKYLKQQLK